MAAPGDQGGTLSRVERYFSGFANNGDAAKAKLAQDLAAGLRTWIERYGDPSAPAAESSKAPEAPAAVVTTEKTLISARDKLVSDPRNPQRVWEYFTAFYQFRFGKLVAPRDLVVSDCPYSEEKILAWRKDAIPQFPFYLPQILSACPEGLLLAGRALPELQHRALEQGTLVTNNLELVGWMGIEAMDAAPYRVNKQGILSGLDEAQLKETLDQAGRVGQTVNVYVVSGPVFRMVLGFYPDGTSTSARLLGSRYDGKVTGARFYPNGRLGLDATLSFANRFPHLGGRSAGDVVSPLS